MNGEGLMFGLHKIEVQLKRIADALEESNDLVKDLGGKND